MTAILYSLGIGFIVGLALNVLGVAVPAPPNLAGVAGIAGLTLGFMVLGGVR